jgi:putative hydrolase of the HAD superfamily
LLFDLGNTLVRYWERHEFPGLLRSGIVGVREHLERKGLLTISPEVMWRNVEAEDHGRPDHRVRPLEGRLARIFQLDAAVCSEPLLEAICARFLAPMFARGSLYEDAIPTLDKARARGLRTAIVSNTPWGSPAKLWRAEVERLGLSEHVDVLVFCSEVGWRKPARQIFVHTLERLQVPAERCLFVGDDPRWDLVGPRALGMQALLIDRWGTAHESSEPAISSLGELWERIDWRLVSLNAAQRSEESPVSAMSLDLHRDSSLRC